MENPYLDFEIVKAHLMKEKFPNSMLKPKKTGLHNLLEFVLKTLVKLSS